MKPLWKQWLAVWFWLAFTVAAFALWAVLFVANYTPHRPVCGTDGYAAGYPPGCVERRPTP
jgi:hypothetical protein